MCVVKSHHDVCSTAYVWWCAEPYPDAGVAHSHQQHNLASGHFRLGCVWVLQAGQHTRGGFASNI